MIITHRALCGPIGPIKLADMILDVVYETRRLVVIIDYQLSLGIVTWSTPANLLERKSSTLKESNTYHKYTRKKLLQQYCPYYYLLQLSFGH